MSAKVAVGDRVTLNDEGLETLYGTRLGHAHMKTLEMRVTYVDPESITHPEETYVVEVDNPDINQFLIYDTCFDVVRHASA